VRPFLYIPDIASASAITFSSKFDSEDQLLASLRGTTRIKVDEKLEALSERLESLKKLSDRFAGGDISKLDETLRTFKPSGVQEKQQQQTYLKASVEDNKDVKVEKSMTLSDIYFYEEDNRSEIFTKRRLVLMDKQLRLIKIGKENKKKNSCPCHHM